MGSIGLVYFAQLIMQRSVLMLIIRKIDYVVLNERILQVKQPYPLKTWNGKNIQGKKSWKLHDNKHRQLTTVTIILKHPSVQ